MGPKKHEDLELAYGAGHINPGYNSTTLRSVTGDNSSCNNTELGRAWDLDYPSFSLAVEDGKPIIGVFTRTVTNVGSANSTYTAYITTPAMCTVEVEPSTLSFSTIGGREPSK
ncbi:Subtilisin-like protease, fibronectin type-III domain [Dillenia turbinata]|uniref:Subtilisin-like protease, fibronectin type-III domain n=1 Tax=Dillenia turbinata TaxID=194707 RepID=A0AAN8ZEY7_9MAGN